MEDLAKAPFAANQESAGKVDHYHGHGAGCEDMGVNLREEHGEPEEVKEEATNEHSNPSEVSEEGKNDHGYPGMIGKFR